MVNLVKRPRRRFTKRQIETAVEVLKETRMVRRWVESQAKFLKVDLSTPQGKEFFERETAFAARRLIER